MERPRGVRNLILLNGALSLWFGFNVVSEISSVQPLFAVIPLLPMAAFILTGPALLFRVPTVHSLAKFSCHLAILFFAFLTLWSLATTGIWRPSLEALMVAALAVYLIGVRGYLNEDKVRRYFTNAETA